MCKRLLKEESLALIQSFTKMVIFLFLLSHLLLPMKMEDPPDRMMGSGVSEAVPSDQAV